MGATRKLQGEIDKVLKKVQEGVDIFDSIWNKVYDTENANQKEKFEADLKKEIKKLQRHRDQIKTWLQSSEIKDKKALLDARKLIEREMERFKVCEKETKTKAFSKEGLGQQPKTDPKEKAKVESRDWLNNMVGELESQVDSFEAELEGLPAKKGKSRPPRLTHLEESISRHKAHITKLLQILRLLDNDEVSPDQVNYVKESVEDYVERNQDDFDEFDDVDGLYGAVLLEKIEALENMDAISNVSSALIMKDKGNKDAFQSAQVLDDSLMSALTENGGKTPTISDMSFGTSFSGVAENSANESVNEASEITINCPSPLLSVKENRSNDASRASSPVTFSSTVKEEEVGSYVGRPGSLARSFGRGLLANSGSPMQSPLPVSAGLSSGLPTSAGLSTASSLMGTSSLADLSKRTPAMADLLAQQLVSPSSSQGRGFLQGASKLGDTAVALETEAPNESNVIGTRLFTSSGGQWRSPSALSFQSQEQGQFLGRTEIAPDQKQKFLQRLQQVNPLLANTQSISQLGTGQKQQFLQNQLLQTSQATSLQQPGIDLGMQNQPGLNGTPQTLANIQQGLAISQLPAAQQMVFTAGSSGKDTDLASIKMGDGSQSNPQHKLLEGKIDTTTLNTRLANAVFKSEDDPKSVDNLDAPVAGPNTFLELNRLSTNMESVGQPLQPIQSSTGPGVIGRRSVSDLGAIGDNLTNITASSVAYDQIYNLQMLEAAFHKLPLPKDSELSKSYTPRHPALTPASYPQTPAELIDNPAFWERLDTDTLFFAFYYQQGTYQQYLAARELKKQSWRYHKKYNTWFQRHEEPKVTTDEFEQGTYVYFDFHIVHDDFQQGWCQRIKTEFTFEYSYLEDELAV